MDDVEAVMKAITACFMNQNPAKATSKHLAQAAIDTLKSRGWTPPKEKT